MIRNWLLLCLLPGFLSAAELLKDGQPEAVIVLGDPPSASAQLAADELRYHIRLMTGAELPFAKKAEPGKTVIYIGENPKTFQSGEFKNQEYLVSVKGNQIVLIGDDGKEKQKVDYQNSKTFPDPWRGVGTLYATYDFLELLGIRWYLPTDLGTAFTPTKNLSVGDVEIRRKPSFEMRKMNECQAEKIPAALYADTIPSSKPVPLLNAQEARLWYLRQRNGGVKTVINHSLGSFYERFRNKPEWFAQGYKLRWDSQLCFTHPEVIAQAVKDARDYFDGKASARTVMGGHFDASHNPDVYVMVPMDTADWCQCQRCKPLTDTLAGTAGEVSNGAKVSNLFFHFVNAVAKEVKKTHPDKRIAILSYSDYAWPPTQFRLEDNIMVELCLPVRSIYNRQIIDSNFKRLLEWQRQYPDMKKYVWLYYCWPAITTINSKGRCFPGFFAGHVKDYFKYFDKVNIQGMFMEPSSYSSCGGVWLPVFDQLELYINDKLAWDNSLSADKLFDEFFQKYYGPAEKPMKDFYLLVQSIYCAPANYPVHSGIWATFPMSRFATPDRMKKLSSYMNQAQNLAKQEPFKSRVELFKKSIFDYIARELDEECKRVPSMQQETVPFLPGAEPGNPQKIDWNKAAPLELFGGLRGENLKQGIEVNIAHDGNWLYLRFYEKCDTSKLLRNTLGFWRDDEWELFFARQRDEPYRQLGICADGKVMFLQHAGTAKEIAFDGKVLIQTAPGFWFTFVAIRLSDVVPSGITPGKILYFNLLRAREWKCSACWIPTFGGFCVPERFGELYLAPEK